MKNVRGGRRQYAALPVRLNAAGDVEVLLVTSRGTRRWIIPKGWPIKKLTAAEAAMTEALEEAGLEGEIMSRRPLSTYRYTKDHASGGQLQLRVDVFLMLVSKQHDDWPERDERETQWCTPLDAAALVAEAALGRIIRKVPAMCRRKKFKKAGIGLANGGGSA